ncbi:MAG TPA: hypothetical protein VNG32_01715 [Candidatus Dormibacteraeota bacterium]|nr:hypothetical protein [Candidatus Dormibacteraeota bacterium]
MTEHATHESPTGEATASPKLLEINDNEELYRLIVLHALGNNRLELGQEEQLNQLNFDGLNWQVTWQTVDGKEKARLYCEITRHAQTYSEQPVYKKRHINHPLIGFGFHGEVKDAQPKKNIKKLRIIKTRDEAGDLMSIDTVTDTELQKNFLQAEAREAEAHRVFDQWRDASKYFDRIHDVRLPALAPETLPSDSDYKTLPIDLHESQDTFSVIEQIDQKRLQYGLPNWIGFTWSVDDETDCRIVDDDVAVTSVEHGELRPLRRLWVIETTTRGTSSQIWEIVDGKELQERLKNLPKRLSYLKDTRKPLEQRPRFKILRPIEAAAEVPKSNDELSVDEAIDMLSYQDLEGLRLRDGEEATALAAQLRDNPAIVQRAEILQQVAKNIGTEKMRNLAKQLRNDIRRLSLPLAGREEQNISWVLGELADIYRRVGAAANNLFTDRGKQRETIDIIMGKRFIGTALGQRRRPEAGDSQGANGELYIEIDLRITDKLSPFIKTKTGDKDQDMVLDILAKVARGEKKEIGEKDYIQIGRYLRMSVGS